MPCNDCVPIPAQKIVVVEGEAMPVDISEHIRQIANNAMERSVVFEDVDLVDRLYGSFQKSNVSCALNFAPVILRLTNCYRVAAI
jgi:hypothetical protein